MRYLLTALSVSLILLSVSMGIYAENPYMMANDINSVSHSGSPFSPVINPVFNDVSGSAAFAYRYLKYEEGDNGNHYLALKLLGFSLTYASFDHLIASQSKSVYEADSAFFNISRGFFFNNFFGWGAGYSYAESKNDIVDKYRGWHFGLLLRPASLLSLGVSFNDAWGEINGGSLKMSQTYSVSARPFTDRVTFSVDATRLDGQSYKRMDYLYGAELRIFSDITMFVKGDSSKNFIYGASLPLFARDPKSGMGSTMVFDYCGAYGAPSSFFSAGITLPEHDYKGGITATGSNYLFIKLNEVFKENEIKSFFSGKGILFYDLLTAVKNASEDQSIDGIVLEIDSVSLGFAQTQEFRDELIKARRKGKSVHAIMKGIGNKEYYIASAADKIYFPPNSTFYLTGLSAQVYYFKGLLDKVGVKFEVVKKGKYKSAMEPFSETGMTREFRENMVSLLADLNNQFVEEITTSRRIDRAEFENMLNLGPITPDEAAIKGLIDEVKYPDEALEDISKGITLVGLGRYLDEKSVNFKWGLAPDIAVIYVNGSIVQGKSVGSRYVDTMGDETYKRILYRAFADRRIRAVVIRVDSGGGSASASDFMWRYLSEYKKKYDKPVVFSFGNMAASGGYYIACTGDKIYASRGTVTGSIGVIFGKISAKELYEKLGINKEVIKMSEFADIFSESRDMTEKERGMIQRDINFVYDRFTGRVMDARKITKGNISSAAEGRIFTGTQAKGKSLVDEHGGLLAAIEYAAALSGTDAGYNIVTLPDETSYFSDMLRSPEIEAVTKLISPLVRQAEMIRFADEGALYLQPYRIDIQ